MILAYMTDSLEFGKANVKHSHAQLVSIIEKMYK